MKWLTNNVIIVLVIVITATVIGILSIKYMGNNNPVEEEAEAVIKQETGVTVEFTPDSKAP